MKGKLSPSLMCADVLNLQSELEALDNLGVDFIHLDFMDNKFVPNITLDTNLIKSVKSVLKNMRRDIHIMAYEPVQYFDRMDIGEIRKRQASPFIAISPDTKPEVLLDYLDIIDGVLVMTVYPGFAGRPIVEGSLEKLAKVRKLLDDNKPGLLMEVDGHVSWDLCKKMRENGADMFVAGSSSLYQKGLELEESVERMNKLVE